jgi:glycosyltransferase involved in cell wall biosynthesis
MKKSKLYFHPLAGEPFGISIAEAMASGLIPSVPAVGGSTEFVPSDINTTVFEKPQISYQMY